jgi:Galactose oxidase, central domain
MAEPIDGQLGRRQFLIAGGAAAVLFGASSARARPVAAGPAVTGSWTGPFGLTLVSIHAVMLHTGSVLPDGRVFIAGGHLYQGVFGGGVANTIIFDPADNSWTEGPLMSQPRWYPTTAQLGDGSVMIFGGLARPTAQATTADRGSAKYKWPTPDSA